ISVSLALDGRVILFVTALSLLAALLSGLAPTLQASKGDVLSGFKHDSRRVLGRLRLRHAFVVAQVALSVLLVVTAGLFVRALQQVGSSAPGFDPKSVELASIDLSAAGYTETTAPPFLRELVDRVRRLPEVEAATIAAVLPGGFEGIGLGGLSVDGVTAPDNAQLFSPVWNIVEPGYFATLDMRLLAGRDFTSNDRNGTQPVVILGEAAARKFWPGKEAVGLYVHQEQFSPAGRSRRTLLVVGVARDPKFGSLVDGTTGIYAYVPLQQQYLRGVNPMIAARSTHGQRLNVQISGVVGSATPNAPLITSQTAEEYAALGLVPQRVVASLSGSLGVVGLLLAAMGIYGVTAYTVTRRTREIGIRMALGARRADVVSMVLRQGMSLVAIGTIAGLVLAAVASQALQVFLLGISPLDPIVFSGAVALFACTGLAACYTPVRRATQIDPINALREE